ncbi:MAG: hypothetical protein AAFR67_10605, partial [Chloroflexota bacterium]
HYPIPSSRLLTGREHYRPRIYGRVYGGGFLDDLTRVTPQLDVNLLPEKKSVKHTDLGFRMSVLIDRSYISSNTYNILRRSDHEYEFIYGEIYITKSK